MDLWLQNTDYCFTHQTINAAFGAVRIQYGPIIFNSLQEKFDGANLYCLLFAHRPQFD